MTRQLRALLIDRDGPRCRWCGRLTVDPAEVGQTADEAATIDHLVPRVDGGSKRDLGNLVLACHRCNDDRGRLPVEEWLAVLRRRGVGADLRCEVAADSDLDLMLARHRTAPKVCRPARKTPEPKHGDTTTPGALQAIGLPDRWSTATVRPSVDALHGGAGCFDIATPLAPHCDAPICATVAQTKPLQSGGRVRAPNLRDEPAVDDVDLRHAISDASGMGVRHAL